jgi:hypothetical protein
MVRTPYQRWSDVQGRRMDILAVKDTRKFQVHCDAGNAGRFEVGTDTLSVVIGQRVRVGKQEEMWDSVHIVCKEQRNGSLTVEVFVCHPDWEETQKVASIHSRPHGGDANAPILRCDFDLQPAATGKHRANGA